MVFSGTTGEECLSFVQRISRIVKNAYDELGDLVIRDEGGDGSSTSELLEMIAALQRMLEDTESK